MVEQIDPQYRKPLGSSLCKKISESELVLRFLLDFSKRQGYIYKDKYYGKWKMKRLVYVCLLILIYMLFPAFGYNSSYVQYYFHDRNVFFDVLGEGYLLSNGRLAVTGVASLRNSGGSVIPGSSMLLYTVAGGDTNLLFSNWKYGVPDGVGGNFTDAVLADVDGDGILEYVGVLSITEARDNFSDEWLYIFRNSGMSFQRTPWLKEGFSGEFPVRPRPAQILAVDVDSDSDEELVVSFFGPYKGISIIDYGEKNEKGKVFIKTNISGLEQFNSILPFKTFTSVIPGEKNKAALVVVGGNEALQVSFVDFVSGKVIKSYNFKDISASDVAIEKVQGGDISGNGVGEIVAPLKAGGALIFYFDGTDSLKYGVLFPDIVRINSLCIGDFNLNGVDEVIISYGDVPKLARYEYDEIGNIPDISSYRKTLYSKDSFVSYKFLDIKPVSNLRRGKTGQAVVSFINNVTGRSGVMLWKFGEVPLEEVAGQERAGEFPELKEKLAGMDTSGQGRSSGYFAPVRKTVRKPDILIHPNESMKRTLEIPGFNFNNLKNLQISIDSPSGMIFDLSTQTFYWTPSDTQLGWYEVNAFFSWDNGSVEEHFTVYVNSPPEVRTFFPERDVIQVGETFRKEIDVVDGNYDSEIFFDLIKRPEGATITEDGVIIWKPDESQEDWHDFILQVTDGYDSTMISFSLFVNHPVRIVSNAPSVAYLGEEYAYDVQISDKNKGFFISKFDHIPRIEDWQNVAVVEIPVSSADFIARMKTYARKFSQMISSGTFKSNYQKASVEGIKDVLVNGDRLVFIIEKDKISVLSASKIMGAFCRMLNIPQPKYSHWDVHSLYEFELKGAPEGMNIDGWGRVRWIPDRFQCGYQTFSLIVSDGYFVDEEKVGVYVNAPPVIVSHPDSIAFVGKKWLYKIKVKDLNDDARFTFSLIAPPEGMKISNDGLISWTPTEKQLNYRDFRVEVSDGYRKEQQKIRVYVNMPPVILSEPELVGMVGIRYEYKLDAEDPNGDPIEYRVVRIPKYAKFDPITGILTWTPKSSQIGINHVIFEVSDNHGGKTVHEFDIRVFKNPSRSVFSYIKDGALVLSILGLLYFALTG